MAGQKRVPSPSGRRTAVPAPPPAPARGYGTGTKEPQKHSCEPRWTPKGRWHSSAVLWERDRKASGRQHLPARAPTKQGPGRSNPARNNVCKCSCPSGTRSSRDRHLDAPVTRKGTQSSTAAGKHPWQPPVKQAQPCRKQQNSLNSSGGHTLSCGTLSSTPQNTKALGTKLESKAFTEESGMAA